MTETNRIIAGFDGWTFDNYRNHWSRTGVNSIGSDVDEFASDLPYHSDWNLLMGVWNKIMSWGVSEFGVHWEQQITESVVMIRRAKHDAPKCAWLVSRGSVKISDVYEVVIQFINWYNQNKNNENY
jgi:hypothetical protein